MASLQKSGQCTLDRNVYRTVRALAADGAHIYPGTCRRGGPGGRAVRVRTTMEPIAFVDRVQGPCEQVLERDIGDFVLYRGDGLVAYQLAVVVDDAAQGVSDVVR